MRHDLHPASRRKLAARRSERGPWGIGRLGEACAVGMTHTVDVRWCWRAARKASGVDGMDVRLSRPSEGGAGLRRGGAFL